MAMVQTAVHGLKLTTVGDCSTWPAQFQCTNIFPIIQILLKFCNSNLLLSPIPKMFKHGRVLELLACKKRVTYQVPNVWF
jgi:hypothetical protein